MPAPVQAYASGVNTLNVEFDSNIPFEDENYFGTTWFTIEADGQDVVLPEGTLTPMTFTDLGPPCWHGGPYLFPSARFS